MDRSLRWTRPPARARYILLVPAYAEDLSLVLTNMVCGTVDRFAVDDLAVSEIMPVLERAVFLLTTDTAAPAAGQPTRPES